MEAIKIGLLMILVAAIVTASHFAVTASRKKFGQFMVVKKSKKNSRA